MHVFSISNWVADPTDSFQARKMTSPYASKADFLPDGICTRVGAQPREMNGLVHVHLWVATVDSALQPHKARSMHFG